MASASTRQQLYYDRLSRPQYVSGSSMQRTQSSSTTSYSHLRTLQSGTSLYSPAPRIATNDKPTLSNRGGAFGSSTPSMSQSPSYVSQYGSTSVPTSLTAEPRGRQMQSQYNSTSIPKRATTPSSRPLPSSTSYPVNTNPMASLNERMGDDGRGGYGGPSSASRFEYSPPQISSTQSSMSPGRGEPYSSHMLGAFEGRSYDTQPTVQSLMRSSLSHNNTAGYLQSSSTPRGSLGLSPSNNGTVVQSNPLPQRTQMTVVQPASILRGSLSTPVSASAGLSPQLRPSGLQNMGNTCYMNSVLQCLLHHPRLVSDINTAFSDIRKSGAVTDAFLSLSKEESRVDRGTLLQCIKGHLAKRNSEFSGYEQADGHEFLRTFLVTIHEELNRSRSQGYEELKDIPHERPEETAERWLKYHLRRDDSVIYDRFGGVTKAVTQCDRCGYESLAFDPFLDLSLAFARTVMRTDAVQFTDMLQNLMDTEIIDEKQQWKCSRCKQHSSAKRSQTIYKFPKSLVLHLKRFNSRGIKTEAQVLYPEKLRTPDMAFKLCGVVCHSGTASMGHYVSYVKFNNGRWYLCNDSVVTEVNAADVINVPTAYILFYSTVDFVQL